MSGQSNNFSASVPLSVGGNEIYATATNIIGTSPNSNVVTITREQPTTPPSNTGNNTSSNNNQGSSDGSNQQQSLDSSSNKKTSKLTVIYPKNKVNLSSNNTTLSGKTDPGSTVYVWLNGKLVAILTADDNGFFETRLDLSEGVNNVKIVSKNKSGKSESTSLQIFYKPKTNDVANQNQVKSYVKPSLILFIILTLLILIIITKRQSRKDDQKENND